MLFVNGVVFGASDADSVGVSNGMIRHVGAADRRSGQITVDLGGRMLTPGFQDAHVHPFSGGFVSIRCDTSDLPDRRSALDEIARYASSCSEVWVRGRGWAYDWFERGCPPKELLDELVPDHPAYLVVRDGHSAWVNSRAIDLAGIAAGTPDPIDGRIERLPDGTPQGTLHEGAMDLVLGLFQDETHEELDQALLAGQSRMLSHGITAWQDAWVTQATHDSYLRLADSGALLGTVRGALAWDRSRGLEQLSDLKRLAGESRERYRPGSVKLMLDGVIENFTASVLHPYNHRGGEQDGGCGIDFIAKSDLPEIVTALDAAGLQCHFHALGDAAVRSALDALEIARSVNGDTDLRHHIAHVQLVDPEDIGRFAELDVVANCQPLWACNEPAITELTLPFIGDRSRYLYPFGSLERSGVRLAMGSDWPVSTDDVMHQISVAVTRRPIHDADAEPLLAAEGVSVESALAAFTSGSAYVNHLDGSRGRVAEGMVADLVVLSADPFEATDLAEILVDLTLVDGNIVFSRET